MNVVGPGEGVDGDGSKTVDSNVGVGKDVDVGAGGNFLGCDSLCIGLTTNGVLLKSFRGIPKDRAV